MTRFTKWALAGAMIVALAAGTAAQVVLADFDDGTNNSNFGTSIYYYVSVDDDAQLYMKANVRSEPDPYGSWFDHKPLTPGRGGSTFAGGFTVNDLPAHEWPPPGTHPVTGTPLPDDEYFPGFGFGVLLSNDDHVGYNQFMKGASNFADVDSIVFWARTNVTSLVAHVKVETVENAKLCVHPSKETAENANAYFAPFVATNEWTRFAFKLSGVTFVGTEGAAIASSEAHPIGESDVSMNPNANSAGDFVQEGWWGCEFRFKPEDATKIAWAFNSNHGGNGGTHGGSDVTLFIDDVTLVGPNFTFRSTDDCIGCVFGGTVATPNKILSNFEGSDYVPDVPECEDDDGEPVDCDPDALQNSRGYYWYIYDDNVALNDYPSEIFNAVENYDGTGLTMDPETVEAGGKGGTAGAYIEFQLGGGYVDGGENVAAFVGIGTEVFNSKATSEADANFLNARDFDGIFLDYRTVGDVTVNFELVDIFDIRDASNVFNPSNPEGDADGQVFYTVLKSTGGDWQSVFVPYSAFVLPRWVEQEPETRRRGAGKTYTFAAAGGNTTWNANELNNARLAELKFKVQGAPGVSGELSIDNVYFVGADKWGDVTSIRLAGNSLTPRASAVRASYNRGVVNVSWDAASQIANGRVSLVNVRGRTITSAPISNVAGNRVTANLGRSAVIPTGMYFVRIDARDVNGARITQQAPVRVVK